jgi:competence protein ComEA
MSGKDRIYLYVVICLTIAVVVAGVTLALGRNKSQPVEITISEGEEGEVPSLAGYVYVSGGVGSPGVYPLREGETLQALLLRAGVAADSDLNHVRIYVPREGETTLPQRIDINRAEPWLLEALPGIGEVLAQRIVDYRNEHGPFGTVEDLLRVSGISVGTLEKIRDYITVSE